MLAAKSPESLEVHLAPVLSQPLAIGKEHGKKNMGKRGKRNKILGEF
jgi:hypothetical protein